MYHESIILKFLDHVNSRFSGRVYEIIVVDGDKQVSTIKHILDPSVIRLTSEKGRSNQMNLGASNSKYNILFFLHADSILHKKSFHSITKALGQPHIKAGAFDLCIASQNMLIRLIEKLASIRSRITQIPYGDQGLFIRKEKILIWCSPILCDFVFLLTIIKTEHINDKWQELRESSPPECHIT